LTNLRSTPTEFRKVNLDDNMSAPVPESRRAASG
jgi:hypothetical protein